MRRSIRAAIVALAALGTAAGVTVMATAHADTRAPVTLTESFELGLGDWTPTSATGVESEDYWIMCSFGANIKDGSYAADYYIDGRAGRETIWMQRSVPVTPGTDAVPVKVSFWLSSDGHSVDGRPSKGWPVLAYAGTAAPTKDNLTRIGSTDTAEGYVEYTYETTVTPGDATEAFVAIGLKATSRAEEVYPVDLVTVTVG